MKVLQHFKKHSAMFCYSVFFPVIYSVIWVQFKLIRLILVTPTAVHHVLSGVYVHRPADRRCQCGPPYLLPLREQRCRKACDQVQREAASSSPQDGAATDGLLLPHCQAPSSLPASLPGWFSILEPRTPLPSPPGCGLQQSAAPNPPPCPLIKPSSLCESPVPFFFHYDLPLLQSFRTSSDGSTPTHKNN